VLLSFLEVAHERHIMFYLNAKEELVATLGFATGLKKKAVIFLKKSTVSGAMTVDSLQNVCIKERINYYLHCLLYLLLLTCEGC